MRAMILKAQGQPLEEAELPDPTPKPGQLLIRVSACGVCRTDLHVVDGDLTEPELPIIPGHQIVGRVVEAGEGRAEFSPGDRVGVPWLGWSCGECKFCRTGRENLCKEARYTGYQIYGYHTYYPKHRYSCIFPAKAGPIPSPTLVGLIDGWEDFLLLHELGRISRSLEKAGKQEQAAKVRQAMNELIGEKNAILGWSFVSSISFVSPRVSGDDRDIRAAKKRVLEMLAGAE